MNHYYSVFILKRLLMRNYWLKIAYVFSKVFTHSIWYYIVALLLVKIKKCFLLKYYSYMIILKYQYFYAINNFLKNH